MSNLSYRSTDLSSEALASESGRVQIWLLTLEHDSFDAPLRFASDGTEIYDYDLRTNDPVYKFVSRGIDYIVCPFSIILPESSMGNSIPKAKISIVNSSPDLSAQLQDLKTAISITSEIVFYDEPDVTLNIMPRFILSDVEISASSISANIGFENFFDNIIPAITQVPSIFPGSSK